MQQNAFFKKRDIALSILLAIIIVFSLLGYSIIYKKTGQSRSIENAVVILNDQEMLSQQMVQTMVVLSIHNSFTNTQEARQRRDLQNDVTLSKGNLRKLDSIHNSKNFASLFYGKKVDSLFDKKRSYNNNVEQAANAILLDSSKSYLNNHLFVRNLRSNSLELQQTQHNLIKELRKAETALEASVRNWNAILLTSLMLSLLFIAFLITAPMIRLNRKTREEAIKRIEESEEKYRHLFQTNPVPMWIYDHDTLRFLEVNQMAVQHYGYNEKEFLAMTIMDIRPHEEKKRLNKIIGEKRDLGRMYKRGVWTHLKKNGESIFVDVISHRIRYNNTMATLVLANDVSIQIQLQHQVLQEKIARQREIAKATIDVQERERNEIGRELHDNVNQILTTAKLYIDQMGTQSADNENHRVISMQLITSAIDEIRRLSQSLVPVSLKDVGLVASIEELVTHINHLGALEIEFTHRGVLENTLDPGLALAIYRIIQEQTTNILKYAEATLVTMKLKQKGPDIFLEILDNGKGFVLSQQRKGVGLANIANRADVYNGVLHIDTAPGKGCHLKVHFQMVTAGPEITNSETPKKNLNP